MRRFTDNVRRGCVQYYAGSFDLCGFDEFGTDVAYGFDHVWVYVLSFRVGLDWIGHG